MVSSRIARAWTVPAPALYPRRSDSGPRLNLSRSRRFSALRLVDDTPALFWWVCAALHAHAVGCDRWTVPMLLWLGASWSDLRIFYRVQRAAMLRWADPRGELGHLPKDRTRVPMNVEFAIHRFNEFMMLMVGEGVLQLIISEHELEGSVETVEFKRSEWNLALAAGFVVCLCMLYSFNITEPHHATGHAFARSSRPAATYLLLLPPKALSILLAGIGIKLHFVSPSRPLYQSLVLEQKLQLSVSLAVCFGLQLVRQPLHVIGLLDYYSLRRLRHNRRLTLTIVLRLCVLSAMVAFSWLDLESWAFLVVLSGCCIAYVLLHRTEVRQ